MDIMQNNEGPSIGKYLTEINCGGWHYSPGNVFQRQDTSVLRGSSLFTASDGGRKKKTRKWRPVGEIIKGDFYIFSAGRSQHTKVRNWELQVHYYGDKYFTLVFKIFRM